MKACEGLSHGTASRAFWSDLMDLDAASDVGIGVVYEQFMLNRLLMRIVKQHKVDSVLESPLLGMAGLTGINSMAISDMEVKITLADDDRERLRMVEKAWKTAKRKARFVHVKSFSRLPFGDSEFGLAHNFAALWHLNDPEKAIGEMARVSKMALICMPNPSNPIFQLRKIAGKLPARKEWAGQKRICDALAAHGMRIIETGLLDIPPWPDTVISLKRLIPMGSGKWRWSMLDYYCGKNPGLGEKAEGYAFIEDSRLPLAFKGLWAHHRYVIAGKK